MKRQDTVGKVLCVVLGVLYAPLSLVSWLLMMASDGAIDAANPLHIGFNTAFCAVSSVIPLLCAAGVLWQRKERRGLSMVALFAPLAVFVMNMVLQAVTESLPWVI